MSPRFGLEYDGPTFRADLTAGATVAAIAIPQAIAYALLAGVDPKFGLYSAIVNTIVAAILGSSSHLINGPTNAISLVVFSALASFHEPVTSYEALFSARHRGGHGADPHRGTEARRLDAVRVGVGGAGLHGGCRVADRRRAGGEFPRNERQRLAVPVGRVPRMVCRGAWRQLQLARDRAWARHRRAGRGAARCHPAIQTAPHRHVDGSDRLFRGGGGPRLERAERSAGGGGRVCAGRPAGLSHSRHDQLALGLPADAQRRGDRALGLARGPGRGQVDRHLYASTAQLQSANHRGRHR